MKILVDLPAYQSINSDGEMVADQGKIDQEKFRFLEYYKIKFSGTWYTKIIDKLVLKTQTDFGFLGAYNSQRGDIPFERFYVGGDGMANNFALDGREVQLRCGVILINLSLVEMDQRCTINLA